MVEKSRMCRSSSHVGLEDGHIGADTRSEKQPPKITRLIFAGRNQALVILSVATITTGFGVIFFG